MAYYNPASYQPPQNDPALQWFQSVDVDRSGRINVQELSRALSQGGYEFSMATTEKMIRMFDRDGQGQIEFPEFQQLNGFIMNMSNAFRSRDADGSGTLQGHEVRAALASSGYQLQEQTFQSLMRRFDPERAGGLKFDDYIGLSCLLGTASNVFARQDPGRTGSATFRFDEFVNVLASV